MGCDTLAALARHLGLGVLHNSIMLSYLRAISDLPTILILFLIRNHFFGQARPCDLN